MRDCAYKDTSTCNTKHSPDSDIYMSIKYYYNVIMTWNQNMIQSYTLPLEGT